MKKRGWHNESIRHSLAAQGIETTTKGEVLEGDKYYHVRQKDPEKFKDIRTPGWAENVADSISKGAKVRMGKSKETDEWEIQSILIKDRYHSDEDAEELADKILSKLDSSKSASGMKEEDREIMEQLEDRLEVADAQHHGYDFSGEITLAEDLHLEATMSGDSWEEQYSKEIEKGLENGNIEKAKRALKDLKEHRRWHK